MYIRYTCNMSHEKLKASLYVLCGTTIQNRDNECAF
jgi:hypothetical protein